MTSHGFTSTSTLDHRPWLWVVSLISPVYCILVLLARLSSKWELLNYDDALLGLGYLFGFVHWGLLYRALSRGLGASTTLLAQGDVQYIAKTYFAARIFLICALGWSKASALLFTRRIFSGNIFKEKLAFICGFASTAVWAVLALLLSSIGCIPDQAIDYSDTAFCSDLKARWAVITALDVATEVVILALPTFFIFRNTLKRSKKMVVVFVYAFRLVVGAIAIGTMVSYFHYLEGDVGSIGLAPTIAWQEVLLGFSLISASIPTLRAFIWAFMSRERGGGMYGISSFDNGQSISEPTPRGTGLMIQFGSLSQSSGSHIGTSNVKRTASRDAARNRPGATRRHQADIASEPGSHKPRVTGHEKESRGSDGSQQHIVGIRRTVNLEIQEV